MSQLPAASFQQPASSSQQPFRQEGARKKRVRREREGEEGEVKGARGSGREGGIERNRNGLGDGECHTPEMPHHA